MQTASYPGIPGAYVEEAAERLGFKPMPCSSFADCVDMAANGDADAALLPVENSTEGSVGESNDLLLHTNLDMVREIRLPVSHCLIGFGKEKDVKTVYSHWQALGQCRKALAGHVTVSTSDTAGAVKQVSGMKDGSSAAIGSKKAARIYGVPVIREHVSDVRENYTRFVALGRGRPKPTGNDKTTIRFMLPNEPGALHSALSVMTGVNMTRIESRPLKTGRWEYHFLVDFKGHRDDGTVTDVLERLRENTESLRVLGSYRLNS